jgi:phage-related protein
VPTQTVFYRDAHGREPVREYLDSRLTLKARQHVIKQIEAMNGLADDFPPLTFPQTSQIEGRLRELRCHSGSALYRILYRRSVNLFVLLHIIRKESRTVPRQDIELAQRRWRDFRREMDTPGRRGPRPAGKDAP